MHGKIGRILVALVGVANGAKVQLYTCNGSSSQKWTYDEGTKLLTWDCNGGANEWWAFNSDGTMVMTS